VETAVISSPKTASAVMANSLGPVVKSVYYAPSGPPRLPFMECYWNADRLLAVLERRDLALERCGAAMGAIWAGERPGELEKRLAYLGLSRQQIGSPAGWLFDVDITRTAAGRQYAKYSNRFFSVSSSRSRDGSSVETTTAFRNRLFSVTITRTGDGWRYTDRTGHRQVVTFGRTVAGVPEAEPAKVVDEGGPVAAVKRMDDGRLSSIVVGRVARVTYEYVFHDVAAWRGAVTRASGRDPCTGTLKDPAVCAGMVPWTEKRVTDLRTGRVILRVVRAGVSPGHPVADNVRPIEAPESGFGVLVAPGETPADGVKWVVWDPAIGGAPYLVAMAGDVGRALVPSPPGCSQRWRLSWNSKQVNRPSTIAPGELPVDLVYALVPLGEGYSTRWVLQWMNNGGGYDRLLFDEHSFVIELYDGGSPVFGYRSIRLERGAGNAPPADR